MSHKYDDIINLPYQKSKTHPHMSNSDRAAQFAPFAALTGYEELIKETARVTQKKILITNEKKMEISEKLDYLSTLSDCVEITIIYFVADKSKKGGKYLEETTDRIKVDNYHKVIRFNSKIVKIDDVFDITFKE